MLTLLESVIPYTECLFLNAEPLGTRKLQDLQANLEGELKMAAIFQHEHRTELWRPTLNFSKKLVYIITFLDCT